MIAFVSGVLATLLLPQLPSVLLSSLAGVAALALLALVRVRRRSAGFRCLWCPLLWLLAGVALGSLQGHWRLASVIPAFAEQKDVRLAGYVTGLPQCQRRWGQPQCRFEFDVVTATLRDGRPLALKRVQLVQYGIAAIDAGACSVFDVRLKRPHGLFNPGSIDFEAAKLRSGIDAGGYVRAVVKKDHCASRIAALRWWPVRGVAIARVAIRERVIANFGDSAPLVLALVLGDYSLVARSQWALFNATGTQHLVTVSGLHIGIAAMLGYWLGSLLALPLRDAGLSRSRIAAGSGWLIALMYSLLAGASTPTLRSLLMLSLFLLVRLLRRESGIDAVLWTAFAVLVINDPLAATSIGFWLSFGAVAVLIAGLQWRRRRRRFLAGLILPQWVVFVGLAPLLLACFSQLPLVSMLANLLAVPWSSVIIMPALVFSTLCGFAVAPLNDLVVFTLDCLCRWLAWCGDLPVAELALPASANGGAGAVVIVALTMAAVFLLLPRGLWLRPLASILVVAVLLTERNPPAAQQLTMDVFDVGQGLAVLVSTGDRHLLFDTGAAWGDDAAVAQMAVLPYLRSQGIDRLDALIVSHADMDHAGGVRSVLESLQVDSIFSGEPLAGEPLASAPAAQRCVAGQRWQWGEARMTTLHPSSGDRYARAGGNNASCVLLIEFRGRRLLLTGDIEAPAEHSLLMSATQTLGQGADVLIAPHHGSHSSSTQALVNRLQPAHVLFAAGYRNRYGHPHADVVARYRRQGSVIHRSDRDGLVRFHVDATGALTAVRWRERWKRYWFNDNWPDDSPVTDGSRTGR
jgi:competence protein ComEC